MSCGLTHTVALDDEGLLYGWGLNNMGALADNPGKRYSFAIEIAHEYVYIIFITLVTGKYEHNYVWIICHYCIAAYILKPFLGPLLLTLFNFNNSMDTYLLAW